LIFNQEKSMPNSDTAAYIPLATDRTKNVVKHLEPGQRQKIDVVNATEPGERLEVDAWVVEDAKGVHFFFQDGAGHAVNFGFADEVRVAMEEAPTEE
jgi:hypothetical protein